MFIPIPCEMEQSWTDWGYEYECGYPGATDFGGCSDCILCGGNYDPATGKVFKGHYKGHLKKYKRRARLAQRIWDNEVAPTALVSELSVNLMKGTE